MQKSSVLVFGLILYVTNAVAAESGEGNLIRNPGFEETSEFSSYASESGSFDFADGWIISPNLDKYREDHIATVSASTESGRETDLVHSGTRAICLTAAELAPEDQADGIYIIAGSRPQLSDGSTYLVSVWIKTEDLADNSAYVRLAAVDGAGNWMDGWLPQSIYTGGTHEWQKFEIELDKDALPEGASELIIYLGVTGSLGKAYFDDCELSVTSRDQTNLDIKFTSPYVFTEKGPVNLKFSVKNSGAQRVAGEIVSELVSETGKTIEQGRAEIDLSSGADTNISFDIGSNLPIGGYSIKNTLNAPDHYNVSLDTKKIFITSSTTYHTMFGVAVATSSNDYSKPEVLSKLRKEGVDMLMGARGSDWKDWTEENIHKLGPFGFKLYNMVTLFSAVPRVCASSEMMGKNRSYARKMGAFLKDKPIVLNQTIQGESLQYPTCYCSECDESFRKYLREKYLSLDVLNEKWKSAFKTWDDISQLGTPKDIDAAQEALKKQVLSLELPKEGTERWKRLFELNRTRAIEWKRWHDDVLKEWYADFIREFKETNGDKTALCEQPCWPDFRSHMLFYLGKIADIGGLDGYLPGELPQTLGTAPNLLLNIDLNASIFQGKPLWVHELYIQDNSPPLLPEAQGWFLLGRGYSLITYFTYTAFEEGEREGRPYTYGLKDLAGNPYPTFESFLRFTREMKAFNERYDALSLRREEPRIALFLGDDVSLANNLETGTATWDAKGVLGHTGVYWLTLRSGFPMEFINDESFDKLAGKSVLLVPWTHVIRAKSVERIVDFARSGGTVIVDGPLGIYDELYRPYSELAVDSAREQSGFLNGLAARIVSSGVPGDVAMDKDYRVLLHDAQGRPALLERRIGRGKMFVFLTGLGPKNSSIEVDQNALSLWQDLLSSCLKPRYISTLKSSSKKGFTDVSLRIKGGGTLFVYLVSFFGDSKGELLLDLPEGSYSAVDALSREKVPLQKREGGYALPVELAAFGTNVVCIESQNDTAFSQW